MFTGIEGITKQAAINHIIKETFQTPIIFQVWQLLLKFSGDPPCPTLLNPETSNQVEYYGISQ